MNSLNKRLDNIEEILAVSDNDIISKLKRLEENQKKQRVESMNASFKEYLNETLVNSHNPVLGTSDYMDVLICTIKYVKLNNHNISRTLNVKPSSELEAECVLHFIQSIYGDTFDEEFIRKCVLPIERLLYPIQLHKETIDEPKEKKKSFFRK